MDIKAIKAAIDGAGKNQRVAMIHYQGLKHSDDLKGYGSGLKGLCKEMGISEEYVTEFRKMINLAEMMRQHGDTINWK